jgi:hypothetical protein
MWSNQNRAQIFFNFVSQITNFEQYVRPASWAECGQQQSQKNAAFFKSFELTSLIGSTPALFFFYECFMFYVMLLLEEIEKS